MIELFKQSLVGQYEAALGTLGACIAQCPDEQWEGKVGNFPFWHVAYHTLFFTDLYLSRDLESFEVRRFHRENYQYFGKSPAPPHDPVVADVPYEKAVIADYVDTCRQKAIASVRCETVESLEGPCGFWWYQIPRAEFHLNNVRHVGHHAAQVSLYLRRSAGIEIAWTQTGWPTSFER